MKNEPNQIKIERGIPIPETQCGNGATKTIRAMKVGDSFVMAKAGRAGISGYARICKVKLVSRTVSPTEVRVWRVE